MKRITPDDVRAAMEKLGDGYALHDGEYLEEAEGRRWVYPITAIAIAHGLDVDAARKVPLGKDVWGAVVQAGCSSGYLDGFVDGFDGFEASLPKMYDVVPGGWFAGHQDGRRCREELLS